MEVVSRVISPVCEVGVTPPNPIREQSLTIHIKLPKPYFFF